MIRRRILGGFFKMKINPEEINFAYGIKKTITDASYLYETGTITGNTSIVTRNNQTYYKLEGRGPGLSNVAFVNFKTYKSNQVVQLHVFDECNSPNDFLAICKLDSVEINPLQAKLTGSDEQIISFTVPEAGSHFIKIYYYQHVDNDPNLAPTTHNTTHAGYFRLEPYYNQYEWGYDAPASQSIKIKSYYGWSVTSKPDWITLDKNTDRMGTKNVSISASGNPGAARSGVIVFTERKSEDTVQLTVSQAANPHPNDIILTVEKAALPNEVNKNVVIGVKLIGNTSYTITNNNQSIYNITPTTGTGDITIKNINAATRNQPITFNITGNVGISKDIKIYEDNNLVSCYCDCNSFNGCGCDRNTTHVHEDVTTCTSDKTWPCPIHCEAYGGAACSAHDSCLSQCKSVCSPQERSCPEDCAGKGYTGSSCSCHGAYGSCSKGYTGTSCSCNQAESCPTYGYSSSCSCYGAKGTCSKGYSTSCSCNQAESCSWHSYSTSCSCNRAESCSWDSCSKTCTCNGAKGSCSKGYSSSCTCNGAKNTCSDGYSSSCTCNGAYGSCSKGYSSSCSKSTYCVSECLSECGSEICDNDTYECPGKSYINPCSDCIIDCNYHGCYETITTSCSCNQAESCSWHTYSTSCSCNGAKQCSWHTYSTSCSCNRAESCSWNSCSETCSCNGAYGSCSKGYSSSCTCNGAYGSCSKGYGTSCSCNQAESCPSHGYTSSCSCYGAKGTCSKGYVGSSCTCHGAEQCTAEGYVGTSCPQDCNAKGETCNKQMILGPNDSLCSCNDKTYYPHCECDNYCPCQGYVIPQVG